MQYLVDPWIPQPHSWGEEEPIVPALAPELQLVAVCSHGLGCFV